MNLHRFLTLALTATLTVPSMAQDRNNEDEVVKVDTRFSAYHCREGEVIVKFKEQSAVRIHAPQRAPFKSAGVSALDEVLHELGVTTVEELMPLSGSQQLKRQARAFNGKMVDAPAMSRIYLLRYDKAKVRNVEEAVAKISQLADVEYAEPNRIVYALGATTEGQVPTDPAMDEGANVSDGADEVTYDDPLYSEQWGLRDIRMPMLWKEKIIAQKRPVIAILDTGVDIEHPDLKPNIWTNTKEADGVDDYDDDDNGFKDDIHGWDFVNQTGRIGDWNGHGTHCAGIAAAVGGNGIGIVGANPDALIMPVTVMQSDGTGDVATIIKGIDYAVANGADVISMSFGSYGESKAEEQALGRAYQKAVLVAAAGNDGMCLNHKHFERGQMAPMPMYPGAYTFVLGVQAMGNDGNVTSWSNYDDNGPAYSEWGEEKLYNYELLAPGATIESTYPGGNYKSLNGTSMATPMVAGALSRLIQTKEYPNKEYLYGDLIHSRTATGGLDIYKAFALKNEDRKPELSFVTYELDDSAHVEGATKNDGDGQPDAGEVIEFYPVVRNAWGKAKNIKLSIALDENEDPTIVKMIKDKADFGSELSAYGKAKSAEPLMIKINDKCADNRRIKLVIKGSCDGSDEVITQNVLLTVENGVEIGGMIKEDMTLYPDVHYIVTKNLAIPKGVTLTIKPGTKLEFKDTYFTNEGTIHAVGKPDSLIVLEGISNGGGRANINLNGFAYTEVKNSLLNEIYGDVCNDALKYNVITFFYGKGTSCNVYDNRIYEICRDTSYLNLI